MTKLCNLAFGIYRKKSYRGKLLNYDSSAYLSHKRSTIKSLVSRAFKICSSETLNGELKSVKDQLKNNGYPLGIIQEEINKEKQLTVRNTNEELNQQTTDENPKKYISTPYIPGTSERV